MMRSVFTFFIIIMTWCSVAQEVDYFAAIERHQDSLRTFYSDRETTILKSEEYDNFKGLDFYDIDSKFRVSATFTKSLIEESIMMETSAGIPRKYSKYGEITFRLGGKLHKLTIYRNPIFAAVPDHEYADTLLLGFTDYTSGDGSYGGGRYIDIGISQIIDGKLLVDFNKSYNPYCAYTTGYACAIPPEVNDLTLRIEAGIKDYKNNH